MLGGLIYGNMEPGEIDQDRMVEVLFEYKGSRRALCFEVSTVCDRVEQELRDLGVTEPNVNLSAGLAESDNHSSFSRNGAANGRLLLMWKALTRFMARTGLLLFENPPAPLFR